MPQIKALLDEYGVINEANKILPSDELRIDLVKAIAELEDYGCHRRRQFPHTRLHKITGFKQAIYRADINKQSGWRIHVQYSTNQQIHLKDVIKGSRHDDVIQVIKAKRHRYD
jgi:hypothetical protein